MYNIINESIKIENHMNIIDKKRKFKITYKHGLAAPKTLPADDTVEATKLAIANYLYHRYFPDFVKPEDIIESIVEV